MPPEPDERTWTAFADLALGLLLVLVLFVLAQFLYYDDALVLEELNARRAAVEAAVRRAAEETLGEGEGLAVAHIGFNRQRLTFPEPMLFVPCGTDPQPTGRLLIQAVGEALRDFQAWFEAVQIEGHADRIVPTGECQTRVGDNWGLSSMRATEFLRVLIQEEGFGHEHLVSSVGRGDTEPVTPPDTPRDGLEPDRRVELILTFSESAARQALRAGRNDP